MRAGKMDRSIRIERMTTISLAGTPIEEWAEVTTLRAERLQSSTEEFIQAFGASD